MKTQSLAKIAPKISTQLLTVLGILTSATASALFLREIGFPDTNAVVIYILAVLLAARYTRGFLYGSLASVLGIICYNFFFTEPYHTLLVAHSSDIVTIFVMLGASFMTSTLTSKLLKATRLAKEREEQTDLLFRITSSLAQASGMPDVAAASVQCLSNLLETDILYVLPAEPGRSTIFQPSADSRHVAAATVENERLADYTFNRKTVPIGNRKKQYGLLCIPPAATSALREREELIPAIVMQIQIAMDRERLSEEKKQAKLEGEQEKFRSNLLRAISHDLRTPLAGISGTAELLSESLEHESDRSLARGIYEETTWLTQMVENILSLTRMEDGNLVLKKQPEAVEEIVGEAAKLVRKAAGSRTISLEIPDDVLLVPMDAKLILQVLINLIENAVKHTNTDGIIRISVHKKAGSVWFSVSDNGSGIRQSDLPYIFEPFYSKESRREASRRGIGLGLSISRAIIKAHGGRIFAENNTDGGAVFRFYLPMKERLPDENREAVSDC